MHASVPSIKTSNPGRPESPLNARLLTPSVNLFGLPVATLTLPEAVAHLAAALRQPAPTFVCTLNADHITRARQDPAFAAAYATANLIVADGQSIRLAARLLGKPLPGRVTGIDLTWALLAHCAAHGHRVFLLGGTDATLSLCTAKLRKHFPTLPLAGTLHGYFTDPLAVRSAIAASGADLLIAGLGSPRQELFLAEHLPASGCRVGIGIGGAMDVWAGNVARAPLWMQQAGLEWLWRLLQEPRRLLWRYLASNSAFLLLLARELRRGARRP
ncbi:MAG: WecB/TagA/CpsF family glycosyltransferase [Acidobacteriota bacterium]|nr:WecB/TagA/CpsF family glycosyltransferase [Bryobacteraceae bacterium CoA2 C42]